VARWLDFTFMGATGICYALWADTTMWSKVLYFWSCNHWRKDWSCVCQMITSSCDW